MNVSPTPDALALQAFLYSFPLYEMSRMRAATSPRRVEPHGFAGVGKESALRFCNLFIHTRRLLGAGQSRVVTPNNDTLYTNAWVDLDDGPLVIDVPDTDGRYYVLGLLDFYSNPFAHLGQRLTGTRARSFLISGPGWNGEVPPAFAAPSSHVGAPTRWVWIIGRILVDGEHDVPTVNALQDLFMLRTLRAWREGTAPLPKRFDAHCDPQAPLEAERFVNVVNRALRENPPPASEREFVARFASVGIGADCPDTPGPAQRTLMHAAIEEGLRQLKDGGFGDEERTGWRLPQRVDGSYGTDYARRAAVAQKYIGALESLEAIYPMAHRDADGEALSGRENYRLRFAPGHLPPVDAFWSLTMYDTRDFMLVANPSGRYAIGDRTPGLRRDADGGLTLHIQHEPPATEEARANWLPAPRDGFYLCLRAYRPRPEMLDGRYALPGIARATPFAHA